MQLTEIILSNFRSFPEAHLHLPPSGLLMVAGANNAGKSALLSALDVIAGVSLEGNPPVTFAQGQHQAHISATFDLTVEERRELLQSLDLKITAVEDGALSHAVLDFAELQDGQMFLSGVRVSRPQGDLLTISRAYPTVGGAMWESFRFSQTAPWTEELTADRQGNMGPTDTLHFNAEVYLMAQANVAPLRAMLADWRERYFHFRALRTGANRSAQLSSERKLHPTGLNLAAVLLHLVTNEPGTFNKLSDTIQQIVPDVGRLQVPTAQSDMHVAFGSDSLPRLSLNVKDLGTGVEQLLLTAVVGLTSPSPYVMVVEEPETNLHPAAQRAMLSLLESWSVERLIIVATHSPVFLNWSPGGDRLLHVTKSDGASQVARVNEPVALLRELGVRLSDVLSADRILVLEGLSDQDVLMQWFPETLRSPRIAVIDGGGGDNAQHAALLARWIESADRAGMRRILYLRDHDELPETLVDKLTRSGHVYVTKRRELENYLLDPAALATVIAQELGLGKDAPTVDEVRAAMLDAAEELRSAITVNRTVRQIRLQPVIDHKLRGELAASKANAEQIANAIIRRLADPAELREQIAAWYADAEAETAALTGDQLLARAPGADVLVTVYKRFLNRGYNKRRDGAAIAAAAEVPAELRIAVEQFMADDESSQSAELPVAGN